MKSGDTFLALLAIIVLTAIIYVKYYITKQIYEAYNLKGYDNKKYFWISFFFTTIGLLLVIALPNKAKTNQLSSNDLPEL